MRQLVNTLFALNTGLLLAVMPQFVLAEDQNGKEDLKLIYGDKSIISIATGSAIPLRRLPAVATVISAADIVATGASSLDAVLETVLVLHVTRSAILSNAIYTIRGVRIGLSNPQVLVLVNGMPLSDTYSGDRGFIAADMPLEHVARIEVIRDSGSALYGADAFSGVINIVTKTAKEQDGTRLGARIGSFKGRDAWALYGGKLGSINVAASLQYSTTAGAKPLLERDAQSGFDQLFGTHASLAPGYANFSRTALDGSLDLSYGKWDMRFGLMHRENIGIGVGLGQVLDPHGWGSSRCLSADAKYNNPDFAGDWGLELNGNFTYDNENSLIAIFRPGAFGGEFKDSFIGSPFCWERQARLVSALHYRGWRQHHLRFGLGASKEDLYKIRELKNFNPGNTPINVLISVNLVPIANSLSVSQ